MVKAKEIDLLIKKCSPTQKAFLVIKSFADTVHGDGKPFLTDTQQKAILDSIKAPKEGKAYNRVIDAEYSLRFMMASLDMTHTYVMWMKAELKSFCYVWDAYTKMEEITRGRYVKNPESIEEFITNSNHLVFAEAVPENDNLTIQIDDSLKRGVGYYSNKVKSSLIEFKSMATAARDFMEEMEVNIEAYQNKIDLLEADCAEDNSVPLKFKEATWKEFCRRFGNSDYGIADRVEDVFGKYQVFPDYESLPVDEDHYQKAMTRLREKNSY